LGTVELQNLSPLGGLLKTNVSASRVVLFFFWALFGALFQAFCGR
jgi:hypothetical protein